TAGIQVSAGVYRQGVHVRELRVHYIPRPVFHLSVLDLASREKCPHLRVTWWTSVRKLRRPGEIKRPQTVEEPGKRSGSELSHAGSTPASNEWTVRDDSSSAAAQCSVGHPLVLQQWTQDTTHRTLPTGRCPQDAAHRTLPTGRCPTPTPRQCHCSAENDPPPTYYLLCGGPVGVLTIEEQGPGPCDPPLQVEDLFRDVQDGKILMALTEELSGCKMLDRFRPSTHHIFTLSNIAKVLEFLEDRNVRVVNTDAADVAEGRPSVILALIWNIIVFFQVFEFDRVLVHVFDVFDHVFDVFDHVFDQVFDVFDQVFDVFDQLKEVTGNLERRFSYSVSSLLSLTDSSDSARSSPAPPSDDHCSTLPSKRRRTSRRPKYYRSRSISTLLSWTQACTAPFGVEVHDFGKSWRSGLAFLALVKCARPELVDMRAALTSSPRQNITQAFREAQTHLGVPPLLEPEDVMMRSPDEQSIITYVSQFLQRFPENKDVNESMSPDEYDRRGAHGRFSSPHCPSLGLVGPDCPPQQADVSSSYTWPESAPVLNGGLAADRSSFSNGQFLHSSLAGHCWSSEGTEEDDGGPSPSEEGVRVLPELDSDEEDAYKYILELGHEEGWPQNELECSAATSVRKAHHGLGAHHQVDGERDHTGAPVEMLKQCHRPSSDKHQGTCGERPELCTQKVTVHSYKAHELHSSERSEVWNGSLGSEMGSMTSHEVSCSSKGGLHSNGVISTDSTDSRSLCAVRSLPETAHSGEDKLSERSSPGGDHPRPRNLTQHPTAASQTATPSSVDSGRCSTGRCPTGRCPTGRCPTGRCPQDTAPQDTAPQDAAPQDAGPQDTAPQDAAPQDAAPQDAAHRTLPTGRCPQDATHRTPLCWIVLCPCSAENDPPPGAPVGVLTIEEQGNTVHRETDLYSSGFLDLRGTGFEDAVNSEAEVLHTVLLLWILTYCIFMLRQPEAWVLF
ncbi:hypothetical protein NFI96_024429, partial [Prochilodus magdalenae]